MRLLKIIKKIIWSEKGQALPLVLMLLLLGGIFVAPALSFVSTSLNTGLMVEQKTLGFYSADAGIEDAFWKISEEGETGYNNLSSVNLNLNGMYVTLQGLGKTGNATYSVKSTATLDGETKSIIVAQIKIRSQYSYMFDNAITSRDIVKIQPGAQINGDVQIPDRLTDLDPYNKGIITGKVIDLQPIPWPLVSDISTFYLGKVDTMDPYLSDTISFADLASNTPLYRDGDLTISGSGSGQLEGTIYVTGTLTIKGGDINLNSHGIYSNYYNSIPNKYAIDFGSPQPGLSGSGTVVANGSINFQPNVSSSENDFVFVMSIDGKTWFKPSGVFHGSTAGDIEVDVWPNFIFNHPNEYEDPDFFPGETVTEISRYSLEK